ncbi:camphor resistance protein CrcB [Gemmobacter aquatilis]|uniref:Fluoride-specific ion channel FluC n=1 Tax=Gemmobacter aquatilis TaxID=933059 RepID=A0A1H8KD64_9RHOB|nr:fluoride efflux transporter CrcB [Gemmobacter aquatilis]SEN90591.1 camphor resistance protein CrcB [Gemmobacter aquatilis]
MWVLAQVALGGALGASLRYLANVSIQRIAGHGFPWHTLFVNVAGSAIMGGLMVALAHKGGLRFAPFLMTGVLGGFTTFSAFSMDAILLWERGQIGAAALYIGGSVLLSLAAFAGAALILRGLLT